MTRSIGRIEKVNQRSAFSSAVCRGPNNLYHLATSAHYFVGNSTGLRPVSTATEIRPRNNLEEGCRTRRIVGQQHISSSSLNLYKTRLEGATPLSRHVTVLNSRERESHACASIYWIKPAVILNIPSFVCTIYL